MENMTEILNSLRVTLNLTAAGKNIVSIVPMTVPVRGSEFVTDIARITYKNGQIRDIGIECDSGVAAIYDIVRNVCFLGGKK